MAPGAIGEPPCFLDGFGIYDRIAASTFGTQGLGHSQVAHQGASSPPATAKQLVA